MHTEKIEISMAEEYVFILVEESIPSSQVMIDTPREIIWVQLHTSTNRKVILGSF